MMTFCDHDWKPRGFTDERRAVYKRQVAPLENGHELHIWEDLTTDLWGWAVYTPLNPMEAHPDNWPASSDVCRRGHMKMAATEDEAKQAVQDAYRELFPIGEETGGHDSGIDYSDLNAFMRSI